MLRWDLCSVSFRLAFLRCGAVHCTVLVSLLFRLRSGSPCPETIASKGKKETAPQQTKEITGKQRKMTILRSTIPRDRRRTKYFVGQFRVVQSRTEQNNARHSRPAFCVPPALTTAKIEHWPRPFPSRYTVRPNCSQPPPDAPLAAPNR